MADHHDLQQDFVVPLIGKKYQKHCCDRAEELVCQTDKVPAEPDCRYDPDSRRYCNRLCFPEQQDKCGIHGADDQQNCINNKPDRRHLDPDRLYKIDHSQHITEDKKRKQYIKRCR